MGTKDWSDSILDAIQSPEEAEIYRRAGLKEARIGGRPALIRQDSPFAELTWAEHMGDGNNVILHRMGKESEIDREAFEAEKSAYWQARYRAFSQEELDRIYHKR